MTGRRVVGGIGVLAILVGALEVVTNWDAASPFGLAAFLVAMVVLDDVVLVPVALGVGWLLRRTVPGWARPPVQAGLVVLTGLALVALPFALSPARGGESGTLLTQPYLRNLALLAGVVAVAVAVAVVGRRSRRRQRSRETGSRSRR